MLQMISARKTVLMELHHASKHFTDHPAERPRMTGRLMTQLYRQFDNADIVNLHVSSKRRVVNKVSTLMKMAFGVRNVTKNNGETAIQSNHASSGNLHTCEYYLVISSQHKNEYSSAVYYYHPTSHTLKFIKEMKLSINNKCDVFIIVTSVTERQSCKYGDRGLRYALLDNGHAIGSLFCSLSALDCDFNIVSSNDTLLSSLLDLKDTEIGIIVEICNDDFKQEMLILNSERQPKISHKTAPYPHKEGFIWEHSLQLINIIKVPMLKSLYTESSIDFYNYFSQVFDKKTFNRLTVKRKSARNFDQNKMIDKCIFQSILNNSFQLAMRLLTHSANHPFPIDIAIIVNHVEDLQAGTYRLDFLPSDNSAYATVKLCHTKTGEFNDDLFFCSGFQKICINCNFAIIFISNLGKGIAEYGDGYYRHIHYLIGMVSHIIHLQCVQFNISGRPIGSFFDDNLLDLLGFSTTKYCALQMFIGGT